MAKIRKGISCDRPPLNGGPNLNHRSHCNGEYVDRHIHRLYVCPIFIPHWMHNCTCTNIYNLQPRIIKLLKHHEGLPQNVINIQCGDFPKRGYIPPISIFLWDVPAKKPSIGASPYRGDSPWHFAHGTRVQRGWWDLRSAGGVARRVGIPLAFQTAVSCFFFSMKYGDLMWFNGDLMNLMVWTVIYKKYVILILLFVCISGI